VVAREGALLDRHHSATEDCNGASRLGEAVGEVARFDGYRRCVRDPNCTNGSTLGACFVIAALAEVHIFERGHRRDERLGHAVVHIGDDKALDAR
jgi:hypothetical protein